MAGDEIVENIKQVEIFLPVRDEGGGDGIERFEYLGKKYRMDKTTTPVIKSDRAQAQHEFDGQWGDE